MLVYTNKVRAKFDLSKVKAKSLICVLLGYDQYYV